MSSESSSQMMEDPRITEFEQLAQLSADYFAGGLSFSEWQNMAQPLREALFQKYGYFDIQGTLDEVREERLNDLMRGH